MMRRRLLSILLIVVALLAALLASSARRLGARVDAMELGPENGALALGDDLPFEEMRIAVVENVLGDDAMLEHALEMVASHGGADLLVLLGNVFRDGTDAEARRLVATCRDRGMHVLAVPSGHDREPATRDVYARWFGPERWWFLRRGVLVCGVPGRGGDDDAFVAKALASSPSATTHRVFGLGPVAGIDRLKFVRPRQTDPSITEAVILIVGADMDSGGMIGSTSGGRALFTPRSLWRGLALGVLYPMTKTTGGYIAFLVVCAVVAAIGVRRLIGARASSP